MKKNIIIGISGLETSNVITKTFNLNVFGGRPDLSILWNYKQFFYLHGDFYFLVQRNASSLCLFSLNKYDDLIQQFCYLKKYEESDNKCPIIINPHLNGVIYANFKTDDSKTRTKVSFDNGKTFNPLVLEGQSVSSLKYDSWIELDFICSMELQNHNFQEAWIVKFDGTYHRKGLSSHHTFISLNGGKSWKMLHAQIDNFIVLNHGGLIFGSEIGTSNIKFSFNEGINWNTKNIWAKKVIGIKPLQFPDNLAIAAIHYKEDTHTYYLFIYNFSSIFSILSLIIEQICKITDFKAWHVPRYFQNCFQGQQISYLKKKSQLICMDNRTIIQQDIKTCPCFLLDFPWY
ncbi:Vacuolar protein sorting/targeting protein 10 [Thelohanellus kitauei]|uniref:Vacuolar protein sorting/targeting protein 10 n=1 Tax=Thelohanellus kitauei TaxID=669202 RepID=A0A0C2MRK3_THEKT|nr:Vacuolar protein sorting/targeting protein 10 [Thelohanellus kitauei]